MGSVPPSVRKQTALLARFLVGTFYLLWRPVVICVNLDFFSLLWLLLATILTVGNLLEFLKYVLSFLFFYYERHGRKRSRDIVKSMPRSNRELCTTQYFLAENEGSKSSYLSKNLNSPESVGIMSVLYL